MNVKFQRRPQQSRHSCARFMIFLYFAKLNKIEVITTKDDKKHGLFDDARKARGIYFLLCGYATIKLMLIVTV